MTTPTLADAARAALEALEEWQRTRTGHTDDGATMLPFATGMKLAACMPDLRAALAAHASAPRAPLTAEQCDKLRQANGGELNFVTLREFRVIARAVERAHVIGAHAPAAPAAPTEFLPGEPLTEAARKLLAAPAERGEQPAQIIEEAIERHVGGAELDDATHASMVAFAREVWSAAIASAPRVPQGWQIEQLPNGEIAMHAQGIGSCVVAPAETQPRIIPTEMLYALAKALLSAAPQAEEARDGPGEMPAAG